MSKNEMERRRQAELRLWEDRIQALKQANLLPEWTAPVVQLIQEKMQQLREEKPKELENLPEPVVTESSSATQPEEPKVTMAQQVQREDPAPKQDSMESFLADLEGPSVDPAPQAKPTETVSFSTPETKPVSFEPVPEPNAAIPTAADKGTEPLFLEPPAPFAETEPQETTKPQAMTEMDALLAGVPEKPEVNKSAPTQPEPVSSSAAPADISAPEIQRAEPSNSLAPPAAPTMTSPASSSSPSPVPTSPVSIGDAADALGDLKGGSELADSMGLEQPSQPIESRGRSEEVLSNLNKDAGTKASERREKALNSKRQPPRSSMSPEMLERWKKLQAQRSQPNDNRDQIGGRMPSVVPGGTRDDVHTMQGMLSSDADMALAQTGQLLERFAHAFKMLAAHVRESDRILDEGGF